MVVGGKKQRCPNCGSANTAIHGYRVQGGRRVQRYRCENDACPRKTFTTDGAGAVTRSNHVEVTPAYQESGNHAEVTLPREGKPPTLASLFRKFEIDKAEWKVESYKINEWQQHSGEHGIVPLYQGKATLVRKRPVVCEWPAIAPVQIKPLQMRRAREISGKVKRAIVAADAQIGFWNDFDDFTTSTMHDLQVFACLTQAIIEQQPDVLVLPGDMLDLPDWSDHFVQGPECQFTTQMAINWFAAWLRQIRPFCGRVVYLAGNHEKRLMRAIITNTQAAYKLRPANMPEAPPLLSIESMLGLRELDIDYVPDYPDGEFWLNENFRIIHGEKVGAKSGQTVMKMLDGIRASTMQGHVHRSESACVTVRGHKKTITYQAVSLPTLARIDGKVPGTDGRENWQQGFAVVDYTEKLFQVYPVHVWGGRMLMFGREYDAGEVTNAPLSKEDVRAIKAGAGIGAELGRLVA